MKFKFSNNLDYQIDAIESIVGIFDTGGNLYQQEEPFQLKTQSPIVANRLDIDEKRILGNVQRIQEQNGIKQEESFLLTEDESFLTTEKGEKIELETGSKNPSDFSIEMETGTGKTYVYLRTALELHKRYRLTKFIILVPSVAIREGVMKTIDQTRDHFQRLYNIGFHDFAYDSSKLSEVRDFVQSPDVQFMVMTFQSFNKDTNVMRQTPDRFHGDQPIELVAQTQPVVIMDEPQNMGSDLSKASIEDLRPLFKLRYSATHKEIHNLMYQLTPVDAYKRDLVKKISVYGVREEDPEALTLEVKDIKTQKGQNPRAKVKMEIKNADGAFGYKDMMVKAGDDIERKTKNEKYAGLSVNDIDARKGRVELSNGEFYRLADNSSENKEAIFRTQIHETIKAHFDKQEDIGEQAKVLSLFFIDRVDNYIYDDSLIRRVFEEEYQKLQKNYEQFKHTDVKAVHSGYFSNEKRKGETTFKDTNGKTKADKETYDLIMTNKEKLLSFTESVSFIFSHSALREGWDNPNVFQICTLNETKSDMKKRQEIGRGLRLPVDVEGDRIFEPRTNVLTVIANESYEEFVGQLQGEYAEAGYGELPQPGNARKKVNVSLRKNIEIENEEFKELWERIRQRTRYNISFSTGKFIEQAVANINEYIDVNNLAVRVSRVDVDFDKNGKMKTIFAGESVGERVKGIVRIGNIVNRVVHESGVTKKTIADILSRVDNLDLIRQNPEEYTRSVSVVIKNTLHEFVINEGLKYTPIDDVWELDIFESFKAAQNKTMKSDRSAYERVVFDSAGEREFAEALETSTRVTLYTKLPPKFVIDTPLGTYNPDWAIVMKGDDNKERLYLVRETKFAEGSTKKEVLKNLRPEEKQKIECGRKHFAAINVDFEVSTQSDLGDLK